MRVRSPPLLSTRRDDGAQRERQHVEEAQVVQEPEVGQREPLRQPAVSVGARWRPVRERAREAPNDGRDRRRREHDPARRHRHENALRAILDERPRAAAVEHEVGEEAGDEIEQAHPEHVDDVERDAERRALRDVLRRDDQEEAHRRVQHDAEQQRERARGVESVEAVLLRS